MRSYKGNPPDGTGWRIVGSPRCEVLWDLYVRDQAHTDEWKTFKLVARERADGKANYWFARNSKTGQIGFSRDLAALRENRPELHALVTDLIEYE